MLMGGKESVPMEPPSEPLVVLEQQPPTRKLQLPAPPPAAEISGGESGPNVRTFET